MPKTTITMNPKTMPIILLEINCIFQVDGCLQLHGEGKNCFTAMQRLTK